MKNIIFLAPPAAGKGTLSEMLTEKYGYGHISTGDLLREEIKNKTEIGKQAESLMKEGKFVSDDVIVKLISNRITKDDCKNGFILDGFPRSVEQADMLEDIKKEIDGDSEVDFRATYFDLDTDILISRIVNRRSCPKCGEIYNLKFKAPKNEGKCDVCGTELTQRKDDNEETAKARFETYFRETAPLIDYYKEKNVLSTINADGSIDEVWERLLQVVE